MKRWLILAVLVHAATAHADPSAADLFDDGKRHFDIGEYAAAITSWKQSFLLSNEPLLLFNIGQAYRLAGNCAQANRFYLNYKRADPTPANGIELAQAMQKCAGVEPATGEPDAQAAPTPTQPPTLTPTPTPTPTPPAPIVRADTGRTLRTAGLVAGGVGIALGAVAVFAGVEASSKAGDVAGQPAGATWSAALAADQASGQSWQTRARVFGAIGGAALIGGGIAYWLGRREAAPQIAVAVGAGRAEVSWACAF